MISISSIWTFASHDVVIRVPWNTLHLPRFIRAMWLMVQTREAIKQLCRCSLVKIQVAQCSVRKRTIKKDEPPELLRHWPERGSHAAHEKAETTEANQNTPPHCPYNGYTIGFETVQPWFAAPWLRPFSLLPPHFPFFFFFKLNYQDFLQTPSTFCLI